MNLRVSLAPFGPGWEVEAQPAPCLYQRETLLLSSPPRLLSTLRCTPCPCLMKEKGIYPYRGCSALEQSSAWENCFLVSGRHLADQAWPRSSVTCAEPSCLSSPPPPPQAISKSAQSAGEGARGVCAAAELAVQSFPS